MSVPTAPLTSTSGHRQHVLRSLMVSVIAWSTLAGTAHAQDAGWQRSVLSLLPLDGRSLALVGEVQGRLTADDWVSVNDTPIQAWALDGTRGDAVTVDLVSTDFDAYLYLVGPGLDVGIRNDDGGGACNARITVVLPADGMFRVVVGTVGSGEFGAFVLRTMTVPGPLASGDCGAMMSDIELDDLLLLPTDGRMLAIDTEVTGQLSEDDDPLGLGETYLQAWAMTGSGGAEVTVDLVSDEFDAYLRVVGPELDTVLADDDSGGQCNSRVTIRLPADGIYRVVVSSLGGMATGAFTLRAATTPSEPLTGGCDLAGDLGGGDPSELIGGLLQSAPSGNVTLDRPVEGLISADDYELDDGSYAQLWLLQGRQGETVTVELVSDDFDSFLMLVGPGLDGTLTDDDSAGDLNSRITFTVPQDGDYMIVVNTITAGATGRFILTLR